MPEIIPTNPARNRQKLDRQILLSLALSPLAAGISTIVGYAVAHWIAIVGYKNTGYVVSASCLFLCATAARLAGNAQRQLTSPDETLPEEGRQIFMAKLALLFSAFCSLVVCWHPCAHHFGP
jgi:hypothetical protein